MRATTEYKNYEIVCIDNIPNQEATWKAFVRDHADKVVEMPAPFNWSRFNNAAASASDGEYLLFLNDDIEIIEPAWLETMLEAAAWPGVGIVGARLLYPNRTVQHAGMFLGAGMGRHAFRHAAETDPGYFGLALTQREVIAVTGACLLVRRDIFERLGRFDEAHDVINNDMDFCLRAYRAGLRTIYTPHASLIHHELASRAHLPDDFDTTRFTGEWRPLFAAGDPYFNPNLSRYSDDYRVDDEGVRVMYAGHPLLDRASVKAILVVKVDHIGDFVTSLPAIRRLKAAFPGARLTALVAPASAAIASIEPAIDECIPFEFFFERSELGEKALTESELDALTSRLAPYRFDIAVDLRKHLSTRHLLLCSGARVLAGYDSLDHFPWLDVVLEWDGDKALQRKRSHIVDDLVNLVRAIEDACEPNRQLFDPRPVAMTLEEMPEHVRHLFARPVVAIHPGSGNVMRQWPEKHIPPLIDLLLEQNDVSVLLIGGRDDEEKANSIMESGGAARPYRLGRGYGATAGPAAVVGRLRAVHRRQQWTQAYRGRVRRADDRHSLRRGGSRGMGTGRRPSRGALPRHELRAVLPGEAGTLPTRSGLRRAVGSRAGTSDGANIPGAAGGSVRSYRSRPVGTSRPVKRRRRTDPAAAVDGGAAEARTRKRPCNRVSAVVAGSK